MPKPSKFFLYFFNVGWVPKKILFYHIRHSISKRSKHFNDVFLTYNYYTTAKDKFKGMCVIKLYYHVGIKKY